MSLFSSIKKVLGFPDEYDEDDEELRDLRSPEDNVPAHSSVGMRIDIKPLRPAAQQDAPASESSAELPPVVEALTSGIATEEAPALETELPGRIFDAVIALFNKTQPEFVQNCLEIESQRKYLIDNIDQAVRAQMNEIAESARRRGEQQWNAIHTQRAEELRQLMNDYNSMKQQREEFQNEQLSTKRQKRAMGERIRDLEAKVQEQTAEVEQFQLENRSMASRLRAMTVRAGVQSDDPSVELAEENVALRDRIASLEKQLKELEQSAEKIASLEKQLSDSRQKVNELTAKAEEAVVAEQIAAEQQAAIAEIEQTVKQFEEVKAKKNKKISALSDEISALKSENSHLKSENSHLKSETGKLRKATEANVNADHAEVEQLRAEVRRLTDLINAADVRPVNKPHRGRKKKHRSAEEYPQPSETPFTVNEPSALPLEDSDREAPAKISAIDELMDSTDWFTAPDPLPIRKDPEVEEEFGYKEPVRKPTLNNDKQLSLF